MLDEKTPYEVRNGKKPNLMRIWELSAVAYVKDLTTGKLDLQAWIGQFVGYDSECRGYCINWPHRHSVTVEQNVIFNDDDLSVKSNYIIIPGDVLAEGERDKVIQHPVNIPRPGDEQPKLQQEINEPKISELPSNSILFLPAEAYYARLNKGLDANFTRVEESDGEAENVPEEALFAVGGDLYVPPLADYALTVLLGNKPKMLDEALCSPHAKQWWAVYKYDIT